MEWGAPHQEVFTASDRRLAQTTYGCPIQSRSVRSIGVKMQRRIPKRFSLLLIAQRLPFLKVHAHRTALSVRICSKKLGETRGQTGRSLF